MFNKTAIPGNTIIATTNVLKHALDFDGNGEHFGDMSIGDIVGVAAAVAGIAGAAPLASGLTVAGLGYTVFTLTVNSGDDITIKDLARMHPDNFRKDDWGADPKNWKEYQDQNRSGKFQRYKDPLTLDLDGDSIETVHANGHQGALFDHNKDGLLTVTGWVAADDGLLVIDKNGDGKINDGGEWFGDNHVLKDGSTSAVL